MRAMGGFGLTPKSREMQGCIAVVVFCVNVGALIYESDSGSGVTLKSRHMQGCVAAVIFCVNISAPVYESGGRLRSAV